VNIKPNIGTYAAPQLDVASAKAAKSAGIKSSAEGADIQVQASAQVQTRGLQASSASFDAKKVQEIKAAIAEGRFQIDIGKVADSLISTARNLIESRSA